MVPSQPSTSATMARSWAWAPQKVSELFRSLWHRSCCSPAHSQVDRSETLAQLHPLHVVFATAMTVLRWALALHAAVIGLARLLHEA